MIEILSIAYGEYEGEDYWSCRIVVDGLEFCKTFLAKGVKTESEVRDWLGGHYEQLLEEAIEVYGAELTSSDLFKEIMPSASVRQQYALSILSGMTPQQLKNYIDNNVTNLASTKEFLKKLSNAVLLLAKRVRLER